MLAAIESNAETAVDSQWKNSFVHKYKRVDRKHVDKVHNKHLLLNKKTIIFSFSV